MSKTLLITGANRGIGFEMTKQAAAQGDNVIACTRNSIQSPDLSELAYKNNSIKVLELDVCDEAKVKQVANSLKDPIDLLVCNAGALNSYGGLYDEEHNSANIEMVLMTNVAGVFFTLRSFLPHLLDVAPGKVGIISSIMGSQQFANSNAPIYRASKAAATNLARCMAIELAPEGIAVGAFHPGWVRTDMGGPKANVAPKDSVAGLLKRFDALNLKTTGTCEDFLGNSVPF